MLFDAVGFAKYGKTIFSEGGTSQASSYVVLYSSLISQDRIGKKRSGVAWQASFLLFCTQTFSCSKWPYFAAHHCYICDHFRQSGA